MASLIESIEKLVAENRQYKETVASLEQKLATKTEAANNDIVIRSRMNRMGVNYDIFKDILDENTVLSGGLIVQTMLGEFWQSDIDIFTTDSDKVIAHLNKPSHHWEQQLELLTNAHAENYGSYCNIVYRGQYTKGVYIEIIQVRSIIDTMRDFDLDFCKCWFDGRNFHTLDATALTTKTHHGQVIGYAQANENVRKLVKASRIGKYERRGFTIIPGLITHQPETPFENIKVIDPIDKSAQDKFVELLKFMVKTHKNIPNIDIDDSPPSLVESDDEMPPLVDYTPPKEKEEIQTTGCACVHCNKC